MTPRERAFGMIISVEDFPKSGVTFRDITGMLADPESFRYAVKKISDFVAAGTADKVAAVEARGFVLGSAVALDVYAGLVLIRKAGKLPRATRSEACELEYGKETLFIHEDSVKPGERVTVVDDVLATGGTALATCKLIEACGGVVDTIVVLIEIEALGGRKKLEGYNVESIFRF